jgi:hypothetical protein
MRARTRARRASSFATSWGAYTSGIQGRLGGRGFKQAEFRKFAQAQGFEWQEIGLRKFVVFGPFQDPALLHKLPGYVHAVAEFKAGVATRRQTMGP